MVVIGTGMIFSSGEEKTLSLESILKQLNLHLQKPAVNPNLNNFAAPPNPLLNAARPQLLNQPPVNSMNLFNQLPQHQAQIQPFINNNNNFNNKPKEGPRKFEKINNLLFFH